MGNVRFAGMAALFLVVLVSGKAAVTHFAWSEVEAGYQQVPLGDVWVSPDRPRSSVPGSIVPMRPAGRGLRSGDVWISSS